jgi:hypothetical protein
MLARTASLPSLSAHRSGSTHTRASTDPAGDSACPATNAGAPVSLGLRMV